MKYMAQRDDFALKLFEVKGDLAYYNSNGEIVIDKNINIVNGERLSDSSYLTEFDGRECLSVRYIYRENGVGFIHVDLNSGEVEIDSNLD